MAGLDRRKFDIEVNGRPFKSQYKNRAAFEVTREAVTGLGIHPQDILDSTHEGTRRGRKSRPILRSFSGNLGVDEVDSQLRTLGETHFRRYYHHEYDLLHVGGQTWVFMNQWSGSEVEQFIGRHHYPIPPGPRPVPRVSGGQNSSVSQDETSVLRMTGIESPRQPVGTADEGTGSR